MTTIFFLCFPFVIFYLDWRFSGLKIVNSSRALGCFPRNPFVLSLFPPLQFLAYFSLPPFLTSYVRLLLPLRVRLQCSRDTSQFPRKTLRLAGNAVCLSVRPSVQQWKQWNSLQLRQVAPSSFSHRNSVSYRSRSRRALNPGASVTPSQIFLPSRGYSGILAGSMCL